MNSKYERVKDMFMDSIVNLALGVDKAMRYNSKSVASYTHIGI